MLNPASRGSPVELADALIPYLVLVVGLAFLLLMPAFGLATAVLFDAFVARMTIVPAGADADRPEPVSSQV